MLNITGKNGLEEQAAKFPKGRHARKLAKDKVEESKIEKHKRKIADDKKKATDIAKSKEAKAFIKYLKSVAGGNNLLVSKICTEIASEAIGE